MPDSKTHKYVGMGAGAVYAAFQAKDRPNTDWLLEVIGGGFGGYLGGILPDKLEPALSSWHRDSCHSWAALGVISATTSYFAGCAASCRANAERCRAVPTKQDETTGVFVPIQRTPLERFIAQVAEIFWTLLAGFLNGLSAGYGSHLVLDSFTPRGLPLFGALAALKLE